MTAEDVIATAVAALLIVLVMQPSIYDDAVATLERELARKREEK